jgi:hypothetical protein
MIPAQRVAPLDSTLAAEGFGSFDVAPRHRLAPPAPLTVPRPRIQHMTTNVTERRWRSLGETTLERVSAAVPDTYDEICVAQRFCCV